ncbi:unnamed protein product [Polarella glacialis]|uniref:Uncharacterized protein n=1 Tax=Polarella glacialis TaxID=89957 RepID=A0A813FQ78_POLGL|nr:unnamed protein product [Polarella glacialis]
MVKCEVCIIGLGVSSLPLVKELEKSGTDYRVVSSDAFGVWQKLDAAGENFDLVTTIESTNYSWWSYDYDFPFYTAKDRVCYFPVSGRLKHHLFVEFLLFFCAVYHWKIVHPEGILRQTEG